MPFDPRLESLFANPDLRLRLGLPALAQDTTPPEDTPPSPGSSPAPALSPGPDRSAMLAALAKAQQGDDRTRFFNTLGAIGTQAGNAFSGRNRQAVAAPVTQVEDVLRQHQLGAAMDEESRKAAMFGPQLETAQAKATEETARAPFAARRAAADVSQVESKAAQEQATAQSTGIKAEEFARLHNEAKNPLSVMSSLARSQYEKDSGQKVPETATYSDLEHLLPMASRAAIAEARLQAMQASMGARALTLGMREEQFNTRREDDLSKRLNQALDPYAMRGGLKGQMDIINRAKRLKALATASPNLDRRQIEELAIGMNALLSGSSTGAQRQVEALVPSTIWGDVKKLQERIANEPTGLDQQKFVARLLDTIEREEGVASKATREGVRARLPEFAPLQGMNRERYESILRARGMDPELFDEKGLEKLGAAPAEVKPSGTVRVKRKSDGAVGSMPAENFDPAKYEKIQ